MNRRSRIAALTILLAFALLAPRTTAGQTDFDLHAALNAAQPGDTIHVSPGTYPGPFVIDKPVALLGEGMPVLEGTGEGDVVTITAPNVTLSGFVVRNSGDSLDQENAGVTGLAPELTIEGNRFEDTLFGIYLKEAPNSIVRDNTVHSKDLPIARRGDGIRLWYSQGGLVEGNYVTGARDVVIWFSPDSVVRSNTVEDGRYGLHFMFSDNQLLEDNIVRSNSVGAFLMYGHGLTMRRNLAVGNRGPSGYGVGLKDVDNIVAVGNRFVDNRVGLYVDNSPREPDATVRFESNLIAYNDIGASLQPLVRRNTYTSNIFWENGEQIALASRGRLRDNEWSEGGRGNYWSDYAGYDADGDAIGDVPYAPQSLYEELLTRYPELGMFRYSPVVSALDFAAQAFPIFQPEPKITDEHPLTAPLELPPVAGLPPSAALPTVLVAVALVGVAGAIVWAGIGRNPYIVRRTQLTPIRYPSSGSEGPSEFGDAS